MFRKLFLIAVLALLPFSALAKVDGDTDKIQTPPTTYTIVCVPERSDMQAFSTNPELVALRTLTDFTVYNPNDPDFKHRWAARLPQAGQGQITLIVEQDGKKLYGVAKDTLAEVCSAVKSSGVIPKLNSSAGHHPFCPNCPHQPKEEPEPDRQEPLRPFLPPLIEKETTKIVEKETEPSNSLATLGLIAAAVAPFSICVGLGSYFITRNIDEQDSLNA